jgi:hypothetical protein
MKYFVAFTWVHGERLGYGNCAVSRTKPIGSLRDVEEIESLLRETYDRVVISSWRRFEEGET